VLWFLITAIRWIWCDNLSNLTRSFNTYNDALVVSKFTFTYLQMWKQHIINMFDFLRKIILEEISHLNETNAVKASSIVLIERSKPIKLIKCDCIILSISISRNKSMPVICDRVPNAISGSCKRDQKKPRRQVWEHRWIHARFMFEMELVRGTAVSKCIIQGGGWLYRKRGCRYVRFDAANSCLVKLLFCAAKGTSEPNGVLQWNPMNSAKTWLLSFSLLVSNFYSELLSITSIFSYDAERIKRIKRINTASFIDTL